MRKFTKSKKKTVWVLQRNGKSTLLDQNFLIFEKKRKDGAEREFVVTKIASTHERKWWRQQSSCYKRVLQCAAPSSEEAVPQKAQGEARI